MGVYGDLIRIYPMPYSIYLRGTIPLNPMFYLLQGDCKILPRPKAGSTCDRSSFRQNLVATMGLGFRVMDLQGR